MVVVVVGALTEEQVRPAYIGQPQLLVWIEGFEQSISEDECPRAVRKVSWPWPSKMRAYAV